MSPVAQLLWASSGLIVCAVIEAALWLVGEDK